MVTPTMPRHSIAWLPKKVCSWSIGTGIRVRQRGSDYRRCEVTIPIDPERICIQKPDQSTQALLFLRRDVRQSGGEPPSLRNRVPAPVLVIHNGSRLLCIAIDDLQLDLLVVSARTGQTGDYRISGDLDLLKTCAVERRQRMFELGLRVDKIVRAIPIAPVHVAGEIVAYQVPGARLGGLGCIADGSAPAKSQHEQGRRDARKQITQLWIGHVQSPVCSPRCQD